MLAADRSAEAAAGKNGAITAAKSGEQVDPCGDGGWRGPFCCFARTGLPPVGTADLTIDNGHHPFVRKARTPDAVKDIILATEIFRMSAQVHDAGIGHRPINKRKPGFHRRLGSVNRGHGKDMISVLNRDSASASSQKCVNCPPQSWLTGKSP